VHKLRVVVKELNETGIWLQMIAESSLLPRRQLIVIVTENQELSRIIAASVRTARRQQQMNTDAMTNEQ
jgi:hypothetical protein